MKRFILSLVGAAALAFAGQPATAADVPGPIYKGPATVAPIFNWTGFYVGLQLGYGWGSSRHTFSNGAPPGNSDPNGILGGAHIGANWQTGSVVFGVEADIEAADLTGSYTNLAGITSSGSANLRWDASLRGRLGFAFDRSLLYVTGGWAFGNYRLGGGPAPAPPCCGYSADVNGWTAGLGWEYMFGPNFTGRVEYRHTDYGTVTGALVPFFPGVLMSVRNTTDVVRTALSYKF